MIKSLNDGSSSTQLGNWLAATFPNMYGAHAGDNDLTGASNANVAAFYKQLFRRNGSNAPAGPPKVDAQVFAVALATYVTNETLAGTTAASYGFLVTEHGVGTHTFNVGDHGDAFNVTNNSDVAVLDLLLATNANTVNGLLYDEDGDGVVNSLESILRSWPTTFMRRSTNAAMCERRRRVQFDARWAQIPRRSRAPFHFNADYHARRNAGIGAGAVSARERMPQRAQRLGGIVAQGIFQDAVGVWQ